MYLLPQAMTGQLVAMPKSGSGANPAISWWEEAKARATGGRP
jgi:hypothetical protein